MVYILAFVDSCWIRGVGFRKASAWQDATRNEESVLRHIRWMGARFHSAGRAQDPRLGEGARAGARRLVSDAAGGEMAGGGGRGLREVITSLT